MIARVSCYLCVLVLASAANAQLVPGEILLSAGDTNSLDVVAVGGATTNAVTATTGGPISAMLWDSENPDDVIVSGYVYPRAYIARVHFGSVGTTVTTLLANTDPGNPMTGISQMSWEVPGSVLIVVDGGTDQVYRVDLPTSTVTALTTGAQPWGNGLNCGARDPITGQIYVGDNGGTLYRVSLPQPVGAASVTPVVSGLASGLEEICFDPNNGSSSSHHHVVFATAGGIWRVDVLAASVVAEVITQGTLSGIRNLVVDEWGEYAVGTLGSNVYKVSNPPSGAIMPSSVSVTFLAQGGQGYQQQGLAVAGGGTRPWTLDVQSIPFLSTGAIVTEDAPSPIGQGWLLASQTTASFAVGSGPFLGIYPDSLTLLLLTAYPVATPGGLIHFAGQPNASVLLPSGTMAPFVGETWDFVMFAFSPSGAFLGTTNVSRVTW